MPLYEAALPSFCDPTERSNGSENFLLRKDIPSFDLAPEGPARQELPRGYTGPGGSVGPSIELVAARTCSASAASALGLSSMSGHSTVGAAALAGGSGSSAHKAHRSGSGGRAGTWIEKLPRGKARGWGLVVDSDQAPARAPSASATVRRNSERAPSSRVPSALSAEDGAAAIGRLGTGSRAGSRASGEAARPAARGADGDCDVEVAATVILGPRGVAGARRKAGPGARGCGGCLFAFSGALPRRLLPWVAGPGASAPPE
jgi:hypothetical protein